MMLKDNNFISAVVYLHNDGRARRGVLPHGGRRAGRQL